MVLPDIVKGTGTGRERLGGGVQKTTQPCEFEARVDGIDGVNGLLQRRLADLCESIQQRVGRGQRRAVEVLREVVGARHPGASLAEYARELEFLGDRRLVGGVGSADEIHVGEIGIDIIDGLEGAVSRDRLQGYGVRQCLVDFERETAVLVLRHGRRVQRGPVVFPTGAPDNRAEYRRVEVEGVDQRLRVRVGCKDRAAKERVAGVRAKALVRRNLAPEDQWQRPFHEKTVDPRHGHAADLVDF